MDKISVLIVDDHPMVLHLIDGTDAWVPINVNRTQDAQFEI